MKSLACLGNIADLNTFIAVCGRSEEETHAAFWDAVRAGLVLRTDTHYKFLHDRVHEAAYTLIPEGERAAAHLQLGRALLTHLPEEARAERVFDLVSQLNLGVALITDPGEKASLCRLPAADSRIGFQASRSSISLSRYESRCRLG